MKKNKLDDELPFHRGDQQETTRLSIRDKSQAGDPHRGW